MRRGITYVVPAVAVAALALVVPHLTGCSRGDADTAGPRAAPSESAGGVPDAAAPSASNGGAPAAPVRDLPRPRKIMPPGDHPPVGAVLYAASDGPHIVVALSPKTDLAPGGKWQGGFMFSDVPSWEARLGEDGSASGADTGPPAKTGRGWNGRGWCIAQKGDERVSFIVEWPASAFGTCHLTHERGGQIVFSKNLGIAGYNTWVPVDGPRYPQDLSVYDIADPSVALVGERLWFVSRDMIANPSVSHTRWGEFKYTDWAPCRRLGKGYFPSIAGSEDKGVFVSYVKLATKDLIDGDVRGTIAVRHSTDGEEWKELPPATDEKAAHMQALALDSEHGLCVVYAAKREGGWPLMAARSADFGQTWGEPVMLTEPTIYASQPQVVAYGGRFYVSYREMTGVRNSRKEGGPFEGDPVGIYTLVLGPEQLPA
ncbi:MAG TPA: hypothetical protein PLD23_20380 [Armatimonadota bacterium]|mgnify:CR=1 FL=1|nr:hypothetical protein [Armatimonadota bacterium]